MSKTGDRGPQRGCNFVVLLVDTRIAPETFAALKLDPEIAIDADVKAIFETAMIPMCPSVRRERRSHNSLVLRHPYLVSVGRRRL
jgi:hypothetical protein